MFYYFYKCTHVIRFWFLRLFRDLKFFHAASRLVSISLDWLVIHNLIKLNSLTILFTADTLFQVLQRLIHVCLNLHIASRISS